MKNKVFTLEDHLRESLKDPEFRKAWEETRVEYEIARAMIRKRLEKKISQRELAKKAKTTQAVISRIESMNANPSLETLQRIAKALNTSLVVKFGKYSSV